MSQHYHRFLLLFVDGVGLAAATDHNPFTAAPAPALRRLLGGPLTAEQRQQSSDPSSASLLLTDLDPTLGVDGLPQSATGQTAWGASTMPRLYVCPEIPLDKDKTSFYVFKWSIYLRMCRHFLAAIYRYML